MLHVKLLNEHYTECTIVSYADITKTTTSASPTRFITLHLPTSTLDVLIFSPKRATCPTHVIHLNPLNTGRQHRPCIIPQAVNTV